MCSSDLWTFKPQQRAVKVVPGETALAFYTAYNPTDKPVTGVSTYNITPMKAGLYFNKIQCFCFTEQLLLPGQSVDMPVVFFVDPDMDKDRRYHNVRTVTLSYTFYETKTERAKTLLGGVSANDSGKGG